MISANEGHVPDTNSKPNDMEIQINKGKVNIEDKDHGSETHEEHKKLPEFLEKENSANRDPDSLIDSEIRKEPKETKTETEAVNRASTSNCACAQHCREADESHSKAEALKQKEDSRGFKAQEGEEIDISMAYQESDNSQTAMRSSYESHPTAKEGTTGVQNEGITPSSVSLGAKIMTNEGKSDKAWDISEQGPKSSCFEGSQGNGKEKNPGERLEIDVSETIGKQDESICTSKSVDSQEKEVTVPKQTGENLGITKAQTTNREASERDKESAKCTRDPKPAVTCTGTGGPELSHPGAQQMKGNADKSGDNEAVDQSISAIKSHGHSILGNAQAQNGTTMMQNVGTTSSLADAKDMKKTKYDDAQAQKGTAVKSDEGNTSSLANPKDVKKTNTDPDTRPEEELNPHRNQPT